ncbi:MAG: hypothetical protein NT091_01045 [Candidatus Falkowbacteria bacterium]|nr:hypothetical protein [Candidatus Falkowbacteria bacterium]
MREFIKKVHSKKHISYPLYSLIGATLFVSAFFAFSSNALTSINLTAPMNNAYWNGTKNIAWTANCVSGDLVNIYYTTNNFDNTIKIGSNINCNAVSSFAWNTTTVADSNSAKVRVTDVTDPNINGSSGIFNVDNTIPTFTVNDSVAAGSVQTDTINITTADANGITSNAYGYSADATCNASDTYGTTFTSGTNFTIAGNHTDYLCVKTVDTATNIAYLWSDCGFKL